MGTSIGELFLGGGWVMWPLLAFSIVTWAIVIERVYVYLTIRPRLARLTQSLTSSLRDGDAAAAKQICHQEKPQVGELFLSTLDTKKTREQAERVTDRNRIRFMNYLKRNLWILGTIGSASPFVGLLGTVVGIVRAFQNMAEKGTGGFSVVAGGISEALIATAAGLIVAIIALLTYNIFVTVSNLTMSQVRLTLEEMLDHSFEKAAS